MHPRFSCDFWSSRTTQRGDAAHELSPVGRQMLQNEACGGAAAGDGNAAAPTTEHIDPAGRPTCLFVPEHYEPNYAYPLIVWLHGGGGSERELLVAMPMISPRNYLGLSFRGTAAAGEVQRGAYHWSSADEDLAEFEGELLAAVRQLRREYHVHSERVFLAGFDEGAAAALGLYLRRPEWYGGAICLGGSFPRSRHALARFRDLRGKRVLIATGARDPVSTAADNVQAGRLLHAAGLSVSTRILDAGHEVTRPMLRQIDHWIMDGIGAAP